MNAFISLARARYSVRKFKDAPISEESLHRMCMYSKAQMRARRLLG